MASPLEEARREVVAWPIDWPAAGRRFKQADFEADVEVLIKAAKDEAQAEESQRWSTRNTVEWATADEAYQALKLLLRECYGAIDTQFPVFYALNVALRDRIAIALGKTVCSSEEGTDAS